MLPAGKGLCRWCEKPLKTRRRSWCSPECRDKGWMELSGGHRRHMVNRRDHGVCASCGIDTEVIERLARRLVNRAKLSWTEWDRRDRRARKRAEKARARAKALAAWLKDRGFEAGIGTAYSANCPTVTRSLWEADHIMPRNEGGSHQLDNLRTLCLKCHADVTRRYAGFRASRDRGGPKTYNP